ncbi:hypothetical protein HDU93_001071 [Gonapodya sp. JEL0774]|nr:hypothetical protein HDU93_001071 [Gonapodya sp. JEL0774]
MTDTRRPAGGAGPAMLDRRPPPLPPPTLPAELSERNGRTKSPPLTPRLLPTPAPLKQAPRRRSPSPLHKGSDTNSELDFRDVRGPPPSIAVASESNISIAHSPQPPPAVTPEPLTIPVPLVVPMQGPVALFGAPSAGIPPKRPPPRMSSAKGQDHLIGPPVPTPTPLPAMPIGYPAQPQRVPSAIPNPARIALTGTPQQTREHHKTLGGSRHNADPELPQQHQHVQLHHPSHKPAPLPPLSSSSSHAHSHENHNRIKPTAPTAPTAPIYRPPPRTSSSRENPDAFGTSAPRPAPSQPPSRTLTPLPTYLPVYRFSLPSPQSRSALLPFPAMLADTALRSSGSGSESHIHPLELAFLRGKTGEARVVPVSGMVDVDKVYVKAAMRALGQGEFPVQEPVRLNVVEWEDALIRDRSSLAFIEAYSHFLKHGHSDCLSHIRTSHSTFIPPSEFPPLPRQLQPSSDNPPRIPPSAHFLMLHPPYLFVREYRTSRTVDYALTLSSIGDEDEKWATWAEQIVKEWDGKRPPDSGKRRVGSRAVGRVRSAKGSGSIRVRDASRRESAVVEQPESVPLARPDWNREEPLRRVAVPRQEWSAEDQPASVPLARPEERKQELLPNTTPGRSVDTVQEVSSSIMQIQAESDREEPPASVPLARPEKRRQEDVVIIPSMALDETRHELPADVAHLGEEFEREEQPTSVRLAYQSPLTRPRSSHLSPAVDDGEAETRFQMDLDGEVESKPAEHDHAPVVASDPESAVERRLVRHPSLLTRAVAAVTDGFAAQTSAPPMEQAVWTPPFPVELDHGPRSGLFASDTVFNIPSEIPAHSAVGAQEGRQYAPVGIESANQGEVDRLDYNVTPPREDIEMSGSTLGLEDERLAVVGDDPPLTATVQGQVTGLLPDTLDHPELRDIEEVNEESDVGQPEEHTLTHVDGLGGMEPEHVVMGEVRREEKVDRRAEERDQREVADALVVLPADRIPSPTGEEDADGAEERVEMDGPTQPTTSAPKLMNAITAYPTPPADEREATNRLESHSFDHVNEQSAFVPILGCTSRGTAAEPEEVEIGMGDVKTEEERAINRGTELPGPRPVVEEVVPDGALFLVDKVAIDDVATRDEAPFHHRLELGERQLLGVEDDRVPGEDIITAGDAPAAHDVHGGGTALRLGRELGEPKLKEEDPVHFDVLIAEDAHVAVTAPGAQVPLDRDEQAVEENLATGGYVPIGNVAPAREDQHFHLADITDGPRDLAAEAINDAIADIEEPEDIEFTMVVPLHSGVEDEIKLAPGHSHFALPLEDPTLEHSYRLPLDEHEELLTAPPLLPDLAPLPPLSIRLSHSLMLRLVPVETAVPTTDLSPASNPPVFVPDQPTPAASIPLTTGFALRANTVPGGPPAGSSSSGPPSAPPPTPRAPTPPPPSSTILKLDLLAESFPAADPDYLLERLQFHMGKADNLGLVAEEVVKADGKYPKRGERVTGKGKGKEVVRTMGATRPEAPLPSLPLHTSTPTMPGAFLSIEPHTEMDNDEDFEIPTVECSCCFTDDHAFPDDICECPAGHVFCLNCARYAAETRIGLRQTTFPCIYSDAECKHEFPEWEILFENLLVAGRFLPEATYQGYLKLRQEEELRRAFESVSASKVLVSGTLVRCPFCDYGAINLLKEDDELGLKHKVEEAMTQAMVRTCPKCKSKYFKEEGCNKMTCPTCATCMCYVCDKQISGYDHFGNVPGKCKLYGDSVTENRLRAAAAGERAVNDLKKEAATKGIDVKKLKKLINF